MRDISSILPGRDLSYNQLVGEIPFNIGFLQVATLYVLAFFAIDIAGS